MSTIEEGHTVVFHYTGKLDDGEVFDSSAGRDPMEVQIGAGQIIPGLESGMMGMSEGETRTVTITPEQAYGEYDDNLCHQVQRDQFEDPDSIEVGMLFRVPLGDDRSVTATVREAGEEHVVLDLNHPLAGRELTFEVECMEIKAG
jgi:peptidylprolyl isomerase